MLKKISILLILLSWAAPNVTEAQNLFAKPESVAYDSVHNRYLVSNYFDGAIIQVDSTGVQSYFKTGLGHCYGNHIVGDVIYVSTEGAIIGLDLNTAAIVMNLPVSTIGNLDGLAADTVGYLYVVDTGGRIIRIRLSDQSQSVIVSSGFALYLQDIIYDPAHHRLLTAAYAANSPIQAVDLNSFTLSTAVETTIGNFDGITIDCFGNVYVATHLNNAVYRFDAEFLEPPEMIIDGLTEPAGLDYNNHDHILAVPSFGGYAVDFIPILVGPKISATLFSDDLYGDGDGILEEAETIEMTVTFANTTGKPITDLQAVLFSEDLSLYLTDNSAYLGDVAADDTADNDSDPFVIEIPAPYPSRINAFYLEIEWNNGEEILTDTLEIMQTMGENSILLVDDDDGDNVDYYYRKTLENLRVPFELWDASSTTPDGADLSGYDIVIWFSGDFRISPLATDEITAMKDFLDGGGKLFLTGQRIAGQLNAVDPDFLHDYLKAELNSTGVIATLNGVSGGQIFDLLDWINIVGNGGANNQTGSNQIGAIGGGVSELNYQGTTNQAGVSYAGTFQMVFFAFGFEAITNGDSQYLEREEVMAKILEFFNLALPFSPMTLTVSPGQAMHLVEHTPEIGWEHGSPDFVQQEYQVQLGSDNEWSTIEMWDSGPVAATAPSAVYAGAELLDGLEYYFRVRISDGTDWTNWHYGRLRMNSLPTAPTGLNPDGMIEMPDGSPELSHENAADIETDELTYSYQVFSDELLTLLAAEAADQPENAGGISSWIVDPAIAQGETYYWRVRAGDGFEYGPWSSTASFTIAPAYICGDANGDESINVGDAVHMINYVFKSGDAPYPPEAGDADCNGSLNVGDAVYLINFVFKSGPAPCATCP